MRRTLFLISFTGLSLIMTISCGPSAEEIRIQREKAIKDSIEAENKNIYDAAKNYLTDVVYNESEGALKLVSIDKQNGIKKEVSGQPLYIFEYKIKIEAQKKFWKKNQQLFNSNWFWENFHVLKRGSKGGWDDWSTTWRTFNKGTIIEIYGEITLEKTDNGWRPDGNYKNNRATIK